MDALLFRGGVAGSDINQVLNMRVNQMALGKETLTDEEAIALTS
jgi:hypothetical protein